MVGSPLWVSPFRTTPARAAQTPEATYAAVLTRTTLMPADQLAGSLPPRACTLTPNWLRRSRAHPPTSMRPSQTAETGTAPRELVVAPGSQPATAPPGRGRTTKARPTNIEPVARVAISGAIRA